MQVLYTKNYGKFKLMKTNRIVREVKVKQIMGSIRKNGWISNPIKVNEKMEVIDGQHRLEALKRLKMIVEYMVIDGANEDTVIALNTNQANWSTIDYITSFAKRGNESYIFLLKMMQDYKSVGQHNVQYICNGADGVVRKVKDGTFFVKKENMQIIRDCLQFIADVQGAGKITYRNSRGKILAFAIAYYMTKTSEDRERLRAVLIKNNLEMDAMVNTSKIVNCLRYITEMYNKGLRKNRIAFDTRYIEKGSGTGKWWEQ